MDLLLGPAILCATYALILGIHIVLPARRVEGYATHEVTSAPLPYRLNGVWVTALVLGGYAAGSLGGIWKWTVLYDHRWSSLAAACVLGVVLSLAAVTRQPPAHTGFARDLFLGRRLNLQWGRGHVDAKMLLYLLGAALLALHVVSFCAAHIEWGGLAASTGVLLHGALLVWFVFDYLIFERVHLYTYDLFAERLGLKLIWGCLAFYPFFYVVGLWSVVATPLPTPSPAWCVVAAAVFFSGWMLSRGANLQKYTFKRDPAATFLGWIPPRILTDGSRTLLCSGFWARARHINYLGEILMASGLALAIGDPARPGPWLYPLYYILLLVPRERDDDRRCAEKYGALWAEYRTRVPWRIIPRVY
jgi:delta14-sterol reductase